MKKPLWTPSAERVSNSNMTSFQRYVEDLTDRRMGIYEELYNWSIENPEEFWKSIWVMAGIIHSKNYESVLRNPVMPGAIWFEKSELNFAENLLRFQDEKTAIISCRENWPIVRLTYKELYAEVAVCAQGLRNAGVMPGDRVAGYISNIPEAVIGMLAATSLGAVWSSCSPEFGAKGVIDRFGQINPKILFASEAYSYNGKKQSCLDKIKEISENLPDLKKVILVPEFNDFESKYIDVNLKYPNNFIKYNDLVEVVSAKLEFQQVPFNHPVYILYSSGTTGKPKCIVHGAGGTLLQHYKELALHTNVSRNDVICFYTTCGWMMWNWMVSSLNLGAQVFLYDGSPVYPSPDAPWKIIEEEKINIFGTSPKFISLCEKENIFPKKYNLKHLKTILSTGSPLSEENFEWVYNNVKEDIQLSSISGGTDIISCFMLGNPNLPVYGGEIQCRGLGMKVEAFDEQGHSVVGKKGELVCTFPFPSMPVYFWDDPGNKKYMDAYFKDYLGIWKHGDYIEITSRGGIIVYGRSDATLNPGGVRIGTAEIYAIVEAIEEVSDSLVIGYNKNNDIQIILFVALKHGLNLSGELEERIKNEIKVSASPRHVPARIFQVNDIPRTINGKKVELAVSRLIHNREVDNKEALGNPDVLAEYRKFIPLLSV